MIMRLNNILRYIILGGVFILPFIPLIVARDMFFPFITGKNFAFRIIVEIILASWVILAWRDAAYRIRFSWLAVALAAFLGIITLADLLGDNFFKSFWSNFERMEGLITFLHLFAYFVVAASVLNTRKLWERFFHISIGVSFIVGLYSIFQLLGAFEIHQGGVRIDAIFGNATYLGVYALFHVFLIVFLWISRRRALWIRWIYGIALALNLFVLINTATRGAVLGLFGGALLATLLIAIFEREKRGMRKAAVGVIVALLILIGGFVGIKDADFVRESDVLSRFSSIATPEDLLEEGSSRFMVWNMAWQAFLEKPVLGWGQGNFIIAFNKYYDPDMYNQEPWFDRAHNIVFDWLISAGALGLLSYLSLFLAALYYLWFYRRRDNPLFSIGASSVLTGLLAAYFFQNLFVFDQVTSYILFFSVLAFIHAESVRKNTPESASEDRTVSLGTQKSSHSPINQAVVPLVLIALLFTLYAVNIKGVLSARAIIDGIQLTELQNAKTQEQAIAVMEENLDNFTRSIAYNTAGKAEVREQFIQVTLSLSGSQLPQQIVQKYFDLAESEMRKQAESEPGNARPRMFLATLLSTYGMERPALEELEKALAISPKKQFILYGIANTQAHLGNFSEALDAARTAFELAPRNQEARKIYASIAIRAGERSLADELLAPISEGGILTDRILLNAYVAAGDFTRVAEIWERRVELEPSNAQAHISLAAAYSELGRNAEAIEHLERAIELNPEIESQARQFIRQLGG